MGYDHQRIKSNARLFYKNNTGNSIVSLLIVIGVSMGASYALSLILLIFAGVAGVSVGAVSTPKAGMTIGYIVYMVFNYALSLAAGLAMYPLTMGLMGWYRKTIYQKTSFGEIFTPYKPPHLWSNIGTGLLMAVKIWLWTLLLIIPGIIKTYSYSQTMYIKAENPNISPSRAIELSKIMMNGHKWDIFYLHLSFLGWNILSAFTFGILAIVYVFPYYNAALAFAYEEIKADAAARGVIDIREINPDFYNNVGEVYPQ